MPTKYVDSHGLIAPAIPIIIIVGGWAWFGAENVANAPSNQQEAGSGDFYKEQNNQDNVCEGVVAVGIGISAGVACRRPSPLHRVHELSDAQRVGQV